MKTNQSIFVNTGYLNTTVLGNKSKIWENYINNPVEVGQGEQPNTLFHSPNTLFVH